MSSNSYHYCVVRECKNTSIRTPGKLWIRVPSTDANLRKTWLNLAKRDPNTISLKSAQYFCEDHFDLENDMENYMQYKIMGSVRTARMKPNCVPTKFDCLDNPKPKTSKSRKDYRRQRMANINRGLAKKVDKGIQVSAVQEHKAVQILLKCLNGACEAVSNGEGAKKSGATSNKRNRGPKDLKVFCPKCKTEVSHTAEGIQEDLTKALIAKVFHYFEEELELLKRMTAKLKLAHLSQLHMRTAQAIGVSEKAVVEILEEEARRKDAKSYEEQRNVLEQEGLQNDEICQDSTQKWVQESESQTESANEDTDDIGVLHEIKIEAVHEEPIVKAEPMENYEEEPEINIEPSNLERFINEQTQQDPISLKMEAGNDEINDKNQPVAVQPPVAKRRKMTRKLKDTNNTQPVAVQPPVTKRRKMTRKLKETEQSTQPESSTAKESSQRMYGELNVSSRVEVAQVKVEKIEIDEEGFS